MVRVQGGLGSARVRRTPENSDAKHHERDSGDVGEMDAVASRKGQDDDVPPQRVKPGEGSTHEDRDRSHYPAQGRAA